MIKPKSGESDSGSQKPSPPASVDDYLSTLPEDSRNALEQLRKMIHRAAPGATETISYRVPTFTLGSPIVAMSASPSHCSLHLMSPGLMKSVKPELKGYSVTTSTVHFTPEKPLPEDLVAMLVTDWVKENESRENTYRSKN